jgi:hypothetical protein
MRKCMIPFLLPVVLCWLVGASPAKDQESNLPKSREASFVESYSPTEWMVKAAGIGSGRKKYRETRAIEDARKCAVYFCLYLHRSHFEHFG